MRPRFTFRDARASDLAVLVVHRHGMFSEIGHRTEEQIRRHDARYRRWARERLRSGELVGVIAEAPGDKVVGSGCIWFREEQPRPETTKMRSAYILSMYTDPSRRARGIGTSIVRRLLAIARRRGYGRVTLHASAMGRRVYERLGFEPANEMRFTLDPRLMPVARRLRSTATPAAGRVTRARPRPRPGRDRVG